MDTLAALHNVAWREVGLGDFGKPDGFNARQLRRMRSLVAVDGAVPNVLRCAGRLAAGAPSARIRNIDRSQRLSHRQHDRRHHNRSRRRGPWTGSSPPSATHLPTWDICSRRIRCRASRWFRHRRWAPRCSSRATLARAELLDRYADRTGADVSQSELVCHSGDVQACRALRVQPQAVRRGRRRPLLCRSRSW